MSRNEMEQNRELEDVYGGNMNLIAESIFISAYFYWGHLYDDIFFRYVLTWHRINMNKRTLKAHLKKAGLFRRKK